MSIVETEIENEHFCNNILEPQFSKTEASQNYVLKTIRKILENLSIE